MQRVVLVTGAARGLGLAIAQAFSVDHAVAHFERIDVRVNKAGLVVDSPLGAYDPQPLMRCWLRW